MVNVDTVYQRVLALANKEQRGYITPQEFNLIDNQAQMDIFEQYFYDLNQFLRMPGNDTTHADMVSMLEEKISVFEKAGVIQASTQAGLYGEDEQIFDLNSNISDLYRITNVRTYRNLNWKILERVSQKELRAMMLGPLTKVTPNRPVYTMNTDGILKAFHDVDAVTIDYIKKPTPVNWTYIVVGDVALVNPDPTVGYQDFELHPSEEADLVVKILGLAGITLKDPNLYQIASSEDSKNIQQEKQQ